MDYTCKTCGRPDYSDAFCPDCGGGEHPRAESAPLDGDAAMFRPERDPQTGEIIYYLLQSARDV